MAAQQKHDEPDRDKRERIPEGEYDGPTAV